MLAGRDEEPPYIKIPGIFFAEQALVIIGEFRRGKVHAGRERL